MLYKNNLSSLGIWNNVSDENNLICIILFDNSLLHISTKYIKKGKKYNNPVLVLSAVHLCSSVLIIKLVEKYSVFHVTGFAHEYYLM